MPYTTQYQIAINPKGTTDTVYVSIYDKLTFSSDPFMASEIISLNDNKGRIPEGGLKIQTIDTDETKFNPIKAKRAIFSFFSSAQFNIGTFSTGEDDRWIVEITLNDLLLFKGFLVLTDINMDYQPDPNIITLTATDNIALLKDVPLTDFTGANPRGNFRIAQFIAWALSKTGMNLNINVCNNICEEDTPGVPYYHSCYVDTKTFEKDLGVSEDCYTVLTKILTDEAFLTQWRGEWWIIRIDEMGGTLYQHQFTYQGAYNGLQSSFQFNQDINFGNPITLINDSTNISIERPVKEVVETYAFENPVEIIDNIDMSRGSWISPLNLGDPLAKPFTFDDWTEMNFEGTPLTASFYIVRKYEDVGQTYEKERYLRVVPSPSQTSHYDFVRANPLPVGLKDKISVSVDLRYEQDIPQSGTFNAHIFIIYVLGSDGQYYFFQQTSATTGKWTISDYTGGFVFAYVYQWDSDLVFEVDYQTVSIELPPMPIDGDFYIGLYNSNSNDITPRTVNYANLQVDYTPFINGSYQKYSSQYNRVYQNKNYKATHHQQVYISDSPKKILKGALKKIKNAAFVLTENFYDGAVFPGSTLPDSQFLHPFGFIQAYSVWNQYNREFFYFDCQMENLRTADGVSQITDLIHNYRIAESTIYTRNKYFMLLHMDQDYDTNQLSTKMVEILDVSKGKVYTDPFEFKYITG